MRIRLLAAALVCSGAAWAGGYAVPNTNARDLSMVGSLVAGQRDAAATYVNPAALAGLEGLSIVANGTLIDFGSQWTDPSGSPSASTQKKAAWPPSAFASYGGKSNGIGWGVGVGFNVPFGGNVYWPNGWPGQYDVLTVNRRVYGLYLTGGIQPIPQVKLGGGLIYYRTTEDLTQAVNFIVQQGSAELGTSGGMVSYDLSGEFTPVLGLPLTIGVDYKHQAVQHLTGEAHFTNAPASLGPSALDQGVKHTLTAPNLLNVGAAYRVAPSVLLSAAWTWDRWVVYVRDVFAGDLGAQVVVPRDYKNGYTFRFGGEFQDVLPGLTLRAGVLRDISPTRSRALHPSIPDADVTAVGGGVEYEVISNVRLRATWFHAFFDTISTTGTEVFQGTYNTYANIFTIGVAWQPGGTPAGMSAALYRPQP